MTPDLEAKVLELGAALRRHTQEEPEHERVIREQMRTAEFAADVLSAWDEQVMHRGRRARHGLSKEHAAYARRVHAWAWYAVECARWMGADALHRAAMARSLAGAANVGDDEIMATRPDPPDVPKPEHTHAPPHWPAEPWIGDSVAAFFGTLSAEATKKPPPP